MRAIETRFSCLGLLTLLAAGAPEAPSMAVGGGGGRKDAIESAAGSSSELIARTRECRDWFALGAHHPGARDWANEAHFRGCRQVIAAAVAHLDAREPAREAHAGVSR